MREKQEQWDCWMPNWGLFWRSQIWMRLRWSWLHWVMRIPVKSCCNSWWLHKQLPNKRSHRQRPGKQIQLWSFLSFRIFSFLLLKTGRSVADLQHKPWWLRSDVMLTLWPAILELSWRLAVFCTWCHYDHHSHRHLWQWCLCMYRWRYYLNHCHHKCYSTPFLQLKQERDMELLWLCPWFYVMVIITHLNLFVDIEKNEFLVLFITSCLLLFCLSHFCSPSDSQLDYYHRKVVWINCGDSQLNRFVLIERHAFLSWYSASHLFFSCESR